MKWKIIGRKFREHKSENPKEQELDIIEADSFDEAIEKAREIYGKYYIVGAQPC